MSDTTPRDQLAALLADDWNPDRDPILTAMFRDYAQTILEAGWRPPARVVSTITQLNALPGGTIIRYATRDDWAISQKDEGRIAPWWIFDEDHYLMAEDVLRYDNATVLWEPEKGE